MQLNPKNNLGETLYNNQLSKYFSFPSKGAKFRGPLIGFELEVEGLPLRNMPSTESLDKHNFQTKGDGSLRNNGVEFVFKSPIGKEEAKECIEYISKHLKEKSAIFSNRTSAHFHINFRDVTIKHIHCFLTLWYLFEMLLTKRSGGTDREGHLFCTRAVDSNAIIQNIKKAFRQNLSYLNSRERYTALNLNALSRFGSLEVRTHRGTCDYKDLNKFLDVLVELYEVAQTYSKASDILEQTSKEGGEQFIKKCLPKMDEYINNPPTSDVDVRKCFMDYYEQGVVLAQDVAYCVDIVKTSTPTTDDISSIESTPRHNMRRRGTAAPFAQAFPGDRVLQEFWENNF